MAKRKATKRIRLVSAYFDRPQGATKSLQRLLRDVLTDDSAPTDAAVSEFGVARIMDDSRTGKALLVHIATLAPGEGATSVGGRPGSRRMARHGPRPGEELANAHAFLLVRRDRALVVTDGLRAGSVAAYFRTLFARRGFDHWTASLDFVPVANDTNLRTLEQDGAREIQLHSTLTAARGAWIADANDRGLAAIGRRVRGAVRAMIEEETPLLRPDKVEVAVSVKVKGGIKRNPNLRDALLAASKELVQDPDSDLPFAIVTGKGDTLTSSDIRIGRTVALERLEAQDCLDRHAVYAELSGFYAHLVERDLMAP